MKTFTLCGENGCCPVVEVDETEVRIGEDDNLVRLSLAEWAALKDLVLAGSI